MNTVRFLLLYRRPQWLPSFDEEERSPQAACGPLRTRALMATAPDAAQFEVILCLPTAPALPNGGSGDFGTSPFYGQLLDKPLLILCTSLGVLDVKAQ